MIVLFERGSTDRYYIKLEIENESEDSFITSFEIDSISVIENMIGNTTFLNIKFIDNHGVLINTHPIIPDKTISLTYGISKENSITSNFKIASMKVESLNKVDTEQMLVSMDLIHDKWDEMIKKTYSKSWKNKKLSEVLEDVVSEIEFDETDIEETSTAQDVIQPNWTNSKMLKWLTKNSINTSGIGGYVYYLTLDNKFSFTTFDKLYDKKPVKDINHISISEFDQGYNFLKIENNYIPTLIDGGFGMDYTYFDYNTKKYVTKSKVLTDINERQLSDWYYLAEDHMQPSKHYDGGRNINTDDIINNRILTTANSVQKIEFYIQGDNEIHIGDLINLKIPVSKSVRDGEVINETYSGYWLVWKVAHLFTTKDSSYHTHLFLTRNGINGKKIEGLVKTDKGKEIQ